MTSRRKLFGRRRPERHHTRGAYRTPILALHRKQRGPRWNATPARRESCHQQAWLSQARDDG